MFAVIQTGGKQYKVAENDIIVVEKLDGEAGDKISFGDVLMHGKDGDVKVGAPLVKGASVAGEILEQRKAAKVLVFKKKRRQNYRRKKGHRQNETAIKITGIKG
jgi:large subunit ribosomal protein L21